MLGILAVENIDLSSTDTNVLIKLHNSIGNLPFLTASIVTAIYFGLWVIPHATDLMTTAAAGLAEQMWGPKQRTLVINSTTNLPELFLMLVSLSGGMIGGIATPLGSNLANIYLIFLVAPVIVISKWLWQGHCTRSKSLIVLLKRESRLVSWHLLISLLLLAFASLACWLITGIFPWASWSEEIPRQTHPHLFSGSLFCLGGVLIFLWFESKLKKKRPELFEDLASEDFDPNWGKFFVGTVGVVGSSYLLNLLFVAWSQLYQPAMANLCCASAIFTGLHYFLGSLLSSLPEITVAVENYERLTASDLNTALASASVSNMSNLAIACLGSILASLFL